MNINSEKQWCLLVNIYYQVEYRVSKSQFFRFMFPSKPLRFFRDYFFVKIWLIFEKKYSVGDIGTGRIENANWLKGHEIVLWNQFLIWFRLSACHHFCDKAVLRSPPLLVWKLRRGQKFWIFIQDYTADRWPVCVCSAPVSFTMKIF